MSDWAPKRFWSETSVGEGPEGFAILLDGRAVRTPAKAPLAVPTRAFAEAIATEWEAQTERVDPTSMPATRCANAAIDKVTVQHAEVADMLADYGDSDLLCYRADSPEELVARQAEAWDPLLDWAGRSFGARLAPRTGVIHAPQEPGALEALRSRVHALSPFELAAFHDLVTLSGSLVLGLAAACEYASPEALWALSRVDETWQEEQWGVDEEASAQARIKQDAFLNACLFFQMIKKTPLV